MRKVLIILWLVLLFLQNFSAKAQNLTDIECTTAWAYDFWGRSDNDKDICGIRLYVEKENYVAQKTYKNIGMDECNYYIYEYEK